MKKIIIYSLFILWGMTLPAYMIKQSRHTAVSLSLAFDKGEWEELDTYIEGYGKYGVCYLTRDEKEKLAKDIAVAAGITSSCDIRTEGRTTTLTKDSLNGQVVVKVITDEKKDDGQSIIATQYVYAKITLYDNITSANDYRDLLDGIFTAMGIDGNINVNIVGSLKGALNINEKNELADRILDNLKAEVVAQSRTNDMFTIYAYSKGIEPSISIGEDDININIAMNYDGVNNRTQVYVSSPVSSLDY